MPRGRTTGIAKLLISGAAKADLATGRLVRHAGMGIVLDSRHVLTCAHVVNAALGLPNNFAPQPTGSVSVVFPLSATGHSVQGTVVAWRPMGADGVADVAILELLEDASRDVGSASFFHGDQSLDGDALMVFGVRAGSEIGNHVEARFMGPTSAGTVQIDGTRVLGVFVQGGFSGAAVWNVQKQGVVGMVVARDINSADRVAYMIPLSGLEEVWPALAKQGTNGLPPMFADYVEEKTRGFVGRAHVFAGVLEFLTNSPRGYLTLIGEPGIGKSAIACELTRTMSCVAHFFIRSDGITKADQFYAFVGDQLRDRFGIDTTPGLDDMPGMRLKHWLTQAAASLDGDKLVLVVDALDECDELDRQDRAGNLLFLPRLLPDGVYFVLLRRPLEPTAYHIRLETEPGVANEEFDLMTFPSENRRDIEQYLRVYFDARPEHAWLVHHGKSADEAVTLLSERSEDNFMFLRHVLPYLENHPTEFAPEHLPRGLREYYSGHWERMTATWREKSEAESVFLTVYVLAKARKPMTRGQIEATLRNVPASLVRTFIAQWREFLEETVKNEPIYRIYHASFAEFLAEQDAVSDAGREKKAAQLLKSWFLSRLRPGAAGS
jgi:hypothetical protein